MTTYEDWGDTEEEKRKHLLRRSTSPLGRVSAYQYDAYGNRTQSKLSASAAGTADYMQTDVTYTAAGTYVASQTDARGKTVTTVTDANKGTTTSVTDPASQTVTHTYDALRRLTQTTTPLNGQTVRSGYAYDAVKGYLTQVSHNTDSSSSHDVTYSFAYDALGRQTSVSVGSNVLSTTAYMEAQHSLYQISFYMLAVDSLL